MNEEVGPCGRGWRRARSHLCANSVCWPSNLSTLRKTSVFVGGRKRIRTIRFHKLFSTLCQRLQPAFEQIVQALSDTTSLAWFLYFMPFIYYKVYKVRYFVWKEQEKGDVFSLETDKNGMWTWMNLKKASPPTPLQKRGEWIVFFSIQNNRLILGLSLKISRLFLLVIWKQIVCVSRLSCRTRIARITRNFRTYGPWCHFMLKNHWKNEACFNAQRSLLHFLRSVV